MLFCIKGVRTEQERRALRPDSSRTDAFKCVSHQALHIGFVQRIACHKQTIENRPIKEIDAYINVEIFFSSPR
ncbi:hypothetical protein PAV_2c05080 [Paenibacillus alvei DSM 29]|nr:hypothetical protein PAV_2c05080 [Paenibacillus alvei DSM 29]